MQDPATDGGAVGVICPPDHAVFGDVVDHLRDRGHAVTFLEPGVEIPPDRLDRLDLLVNKKVRWESLHALEYAHRNGIAAWNDYEATSLFLNRLSQLRALDAVGFRTPDVRPAKPDGDHVAKEFFEVDDGDPVLDGEGDFYQSLVPSSGVDRKYYAVDDGETVRAAVVRFRSKLYGERELLGPGDTDPDVVDRIGRLLRFTGAAAVGVDVVDGEDGDVAVDVNPATSFRHTDLEGALADSIVARLPERAESTE